jgi:hypothetical protein
MSSYRFLFIAQISRYLVNYENLMIFVVPAIVDNVLITPKKMFTITVAGAGLKNSYSITLEL